MRLNRQTTGALWLLATAAMLASCSSDGFDSAGPPANGGSSGVGGSEGGTAGKNSGSGGTAGSAGSTGGAGGANCPSACDDGNPCNGLELCNGGSCQNGQPRADGSPCGDGNICVASGCQPSECGDGHLDSRTEFCEASPGCDANCKYETAISAGGRHTCALLETGAVRCWGRNKNGQLGYGHRDNVSDGLGPSISESGDVPIGGPTIAISAGAEHTCALLPTGAVRCWGRGDHGRLGHLDWDGIGDGEGLSISDAADAPILIGKATAIAAGGEHTCALIDDGSVQCWGRGHFGALGYNRDTEESDGPVPLGGMATAVAAGDRHSCALLTTGAVRCWGQHGHGYEPSPVIVGDGTGPTILEVGDLPLGARAVALSAGGNHTCALLDTGGVRCWGSGGQGQVGDGGVGGPAGMVDVPVGATAKAIAAGGHHSCAVLETGNVRCWGNGWVLGYEQRTNVGDSNGRTIEEAGDVLSVLNTRSITTGALHTCVLSNANSIRCWGGGNSGQLGYDSQADLGDEPGEMSMPGVSLY